MRTWPDGEFIERMLEWFAGQIDDVKVSPSACQQLGYKLSDLALARHARLAAGCARRRARSAPDP